MDSEFDRALSREIALIGADDNFDRLVGEAEDLQYPEDEPEPETCPDHGELLPCFSCARECEMEEFPDYPEPEITEHQIPGVTLNGGPVFEEDFE